MAKEIPDLVAVARTGTGKGAARQARRNGMVPGVVYGGGVDPLPIEVPFNELLKRLKAGRFKSTLYNLKVDGQDDVRVICRDVQRVSIEKYFLTRRYQLKCLLNATCDKNHGAFLGTRMASETAKLQKLVVFASIFGCIRLLIRASKERKRKRNA